MAHAGQCSVLGSVRPMVTPGRSPTPIDALIACATRFPARGTAGAGAGAAAAAAVPPPGMAHAIALTRASAWTAPANHSLPCHCCVNAVARPRLLPHGRQASTWATRCARQPHAPHRWPRTHGEDGAAAPQASGLALCSPEPLQCLGCCPDSCWRGQRVAAGPPSKRHHHERC